MYYNHADEISAIRVKLEFFFQSANKKIFLYSKSIIVIYTIKYSLLVFYILISGI
jgi:hypothetical protein